MNFTAENTAIVVDSTADFPEATDRFLNWRIVPLYVRFGDESFRDYVELSPARFYERLRVADELPTTSQPTPGDFLACYERLNAYERVLSIHIAGGFSGTVESARAAAKEVGGEKVRVIDSGTASAGIAMLGLAIQRRLERGTSDEEIDELVARYRPQLGLLFTVETLEYLRRGGRIGRARALAGDMLSIRPILTIVDAEVVPVKRVRGNHKAFLEFASQFESRSRDVPDLKVGIAHADAPQKAEALHELVRRTRPQAEIELSTTLGPVLGTHAGPGTVGFFWFEEQLTETALVIPVPAAEPLGPWIGDREGVPMHVTLLYPFAPPSLIEDGSLVDLFSSFEPFDYRLVELRSFDDGTIYLAPEPTEPFVLVTWAVRRRWPEYPPYGGDLRDPVPHVTVPPENVDRARIGALLPLHGRAEEAWLLERGAERWTRRASFAFSDGRGS